MFPSQTGTGSYVDKEGKIRHRKAVGEDIPEQILEGNAQREGRLMGKKEMEQQLKVGTEREGRREGERERERERERWIGRERVRQLK